MKLRRSRKTALAACILLLLLSWRVVSDIRASKAEGGIEPSTWLWSLSAASTVSPPLRDLADYGDQQSATDVRSLYLIVLPSTGRDGRMHTFAEMNEIMDYQAERPLLNALFLDDSCGVGLTAEEAAMAHLGRMPDASLVPNATVTLRGHSTIENEKKSYKIRLNQGEPAWQGQSVINLNKHVFDDSRIRNKIAFDLFRLIPGLTSMHTQFVHLHVMDLSGSGDGGFVDYGLFTQIEQANETFLKGHGLDPDGSFYKAENFEFFRYPDVLRNPGDPAYQVERFETRLEILAGSSHRKLLQMLDDINDPTRDIDLVLSRHFNRENYFAWMATNILLGNYDTQTQNFLLYSPHDALTWYFLPWDYDGSMDALPKRMSDSEGNLVQFIGVANYWNSVLHNRVFRKPENVAALDAAVERIHTILSGGAISAAVDRYLPIVERYYLHGHSIEPHFKADELYASAELIRQTLDSNYRRYVETREKPMPVFLGNVEPTESGEQFYWSASFDLQGDRVSYALQVSPTPDFRTITFEKTRLATTTYVYDLPPGDYFWRIIVTDAKGYTQRAFDTWRDENNIKLKYYGLRKITVR